MKRTLPTVLILLVMVLVGAMYWVDMSYYTDPATGFVTRGEVWMRYLVLLLPLAMGLLGLRIVGPRAIAVLRLRNRPLAGLFAVAGLVGFVYGVALLAQGIQAVSVYHIVLGAFFLWYGVWMVMCALQLFVQRSPSPTNSAVLGIVAALPFCLLCVYRVLAKPTSLYRIAPLVRNFSALFAMLWFGLLLRALYIALTRRRVRWMYLFGVFTFLFATCLEFPQAIHGAIFGSVTAMEMLEAVNMGLLGLVAGCVSVAIARQGGAVPAQEVYYRQAG